MSSLSTTNVNDLGHSFDEKENNDACHAFSPLVNVVLSSTSSTGSTSSFPSSSTPSRHHRQQHTPNSSVTTSAAPSVHTRPAAIDFSLRHGSEADFLHIGGQFQADVPRGIEAWHAHTKDITFDQHYNACVLVS